MHGQAQAVGYAGAGSTRGAPGDIESATLDDPRCAEPQTNHAKKAFALMVVDPKAACKQARNAKAVLAAQANQLPAPSCFKSLRLPPRGSAFARVTGST